MLLRSTILKNDPVTMELIIFAKTNKPFERTAKGSVARVQSLQFYEDDIETMYTQN